MYRVVVSDLDGTLLDNKHDIAPCTLDVFRRLKAGVQFILATGRPCADAIAYCKEIGIEMYLVSSNGARVHDQDGQLIIQHDIPESRVSQLLQLGERFKGRVITNLYRDNEWYVNKHIPIMDKFHKFSDMSPTICETQNMPTEGVCKAFFMAATQDHLFDLVDEFETEIGRSLSSTWSGRNCFEIMAEGVSKAQAIDEVLSKLEPVVSMKDVMAFGDGLNDLQMLERAGRGLVMGNADPRLKEALPEHAVIKRNDQEGVARYLNSYFLNQ